MELIDRLRSDLFGVDSRERQVDSVRDPLCVAQGELGQIKERTGFVVNLMERMQRSVGHGKSATVADVMTDRAK